MTRSEQIGDLITALADAQAEFVAVKKTKLATVKTKTGGEYKYKYADIADVLEMALPRLSKHGIAFMQPHLMVDGKLRVCTLLLHKSGQWMQSDGLEISEAGEPQQFGGESTYFRRYDGCSTLGIASDEDTDAQGTEARKPAAEVKAAARKRAEEIQNPPSDAGPFELKGDILKCVIRSAVQKETSGDKPRQYTLVTWNGSLQGLNFASCFDTAQEDALQCGVGKVCHLKMKVWKEGDKFLNILAVAAIDGNIYEGGAPTGEVLP